MRVFARRAGIGRARQQAPAGLLQLGLQRLRTQVVALEVGEVVAGAHQFDEAQADVALAQVVQPHRQLVVVEALQQHRVELDRLEAEAPCQLDPAQDFIQAVVAGDGVEALAVQRIHADVEVGQPGLAPARHPAVEQGAVGGQGDAVDAAHRRRRGDDLRQVAAQAGFAAGQPQLAQAHIREAAQEARDFLAAKRLRPVGTRVEAVRQAVAATEIAGLDDREPQIREVPAEPVLQDCHVVLLSKRGRRHRFQWRRVAGSATVGGHARGRRPRDSECSASCPGSLFRRFQPLH